VTPKAEGVKKLFLLVPLLAGCAHRPPPRQYEVSCYSGGKLIKGIQHAREPSAGPSGTWRVVDIFGNLYDVRADCVAVPEEP